MDEIGERFKCKEVFVPEMLVAARAMKHAMPLLEPLLVEGGIAPDQTVVIGTVEGDLHDIGKNLVALMWRGANAEVVDIGVNVTPERFVAAVSEHSATAVKWLDNILKRADWVVKITDSTGRGGSGFLVRGGDIAPDLPERVLITNFHVLNREGASTGMRPDVDQKVRLHHHVLIVFYNDHCITRISQRFERIDQSGIVSLVKPNARLVEHIQYAHQPAAHLGGQSDPLRLPTR